MGDPDDAAMTVSIERSVLLWCMRVQAAEGAAARPRIASAFRKIGAPEGAAHFSVFMGAVGEGALWPVDVQGVGWRGITPDEHALLESCALAQCRRCTEACWLLRGLLDDRCAGIALGRAEQLGDCLAEAGWLLSAGHSAEP